MEGKTHIVGGLAAGAAFVVFKGPIPGEALFYASCMAGALVPDICSPTSTIGRKLPILSFLTSKTFGHRTFTHSLVFLVITLLLFSRTAWTDSIELGIWLGMASHIFLDALTKDGVQFFWPFNVRVGIPFGITTGGEIEKGFLSILIVLLGYCGYQIYF